MTRPACLVLVLAVALASASCSRPPVAASRPPRIVRSSPATASIDSRTDSLVTKVSAFDVPQRLDIELWTQRSKPLPSAASSLSVAISAMATTDSMPVSLPYAEFQAVTSTGVVPLDWEERIAKGPASIHGFNCMFSILSLPASSEGIVATVHMGPTAAAARTGVRIVVSLKDIPVVAHVRPLAPWGYSRSF